MESRRAVWATSTPVSLWTVTIIVDVDPSASGTISTGVSVSHADGDPFPLDNTDSEDTTVIQPQADLSISKTDSIDPVVAGQLLAYTLTVNNAGTQTATDVTVTDTLPVA